jgi:hypothetical protein
LSLEPPRSPTPSPNDHVRTLVEFLRPCGPDLARRWLGALTLVPADERAALVDEVERRIVQTYGAPLTSSAAAAPAHDPAPVQPGADELTVVHPPVAHSGYVEQVHVTYARVHPQTQAGAQDDAAAKKFG